MTSAKQRREAARAAQSRNADEAAATARNNARRCTRGERVATKLFHNPAAKLTPRETDDLETYLRNS